MDFYAFYRGEEYRAYTYLGCHRTQNGTIFRVFAPSARAISLISSLNGWQEIPLHKVYDGNFWETEVSGITEGMLYKYRITGQDGKTLDHADPYGYGMELRPHSASVVRFLTSSASVAPLKKRSASPSKPVNIYELHVGSWKRKSDGSWYSYRELAELLPDYLVERGYTHVEMMPLGEHPCDESWGYQQTGFFSVTSRYGTLDDLRFLMSSLHRKGIAVILDYVGVHFAVDDYALSRFDGTALYEYPHSDVGYSEWGSCNFMHSRGEVRSFLSSVAFFALDVCGFDGLRMDAVSNMVYWQGDEKRGVNANGVQFLKFLNSTVKREYPDVLLIAEDSSQYPGVTKSTQEGGLGFDYKWDLGWMHDTLQYFSLSEEEKKNQSRLLSFSMYYFRKEHYLLPISHDEVVHGKKALLDKMAGDYDEKFRMMRLFFMYQMAHPGKKLEFMGSEFGQLREWDEKRECDWNLLDYPTHRDLFAFTKALSFFYLDHPALWADDYQESGFRFIETGEHIPGLTIFNRQCKDETITAVFHFCSGPIPYDVDKLGKVIFSSSPTWQSDNRPCALYVKN